MQSGIMDDAELLAMEVTLFQPIFMPIRTVELFDRALTVNLTTCLNQTCRWNYWEVDISRLLTEVCLGCRSELFERDLNPSNGVINGDGHQKYKQT